MDQTQDNNSTQADQNQNVPADQPNDDTKPGENEAEDKVAEPEEKPEPPKVDEPGLTEAVAPAEPEINDPCDGAGEVRPSSNNHLTVPEDSLKDEPEVVEAPKPVTASISTRPADEDDFFSETPLSKNAGKSRGVFIHGGDESPDFKNTRIDVQQYDASIKAGKQDDQPEMANQTNAVKAVTTATAVMGLVLLFGLGAGFFGYRYSGQFIKNNAVSADTVTTSEPIILPSSSASPSPSVSASANPASDWQSYTNNKYKYSVKYPSDWTGRNTSNTEADTAAFSLADSNSDITKVEISFKKTDGLLLKPWIDEDNKVTGVVGQVITTKIDQKNAYQQFTTKPAKSIVTYVFQNDKVMIITYSAPTSNFDTNKTIYQEILDSIKLQ